MTAWTYDSFQIGAVNGSEEFRLGVSINFDMQGAKSIRVYSNLSPYIYLKFKIHVYNDFNQRKNDPRSDVGNWRNYDKAWKKIFSRLLEGISVRDLHDYTI